MKTDFVRKSKQSTLPAKQCVVFRVMTDPNPNHEIAFALRDCAVMNSNARRIKSGMTFQLLKSNRAMFRIRLPEAITLIRQSLCSLGQ